MAAASRWKKSVRRPALDKWISYEIKKKIPIIYFGTKNIKIRIAE
jgi:hypothetical protein